MVLKFFLNDLSYSVVSKTQRQHQQLVGPTKGQLGVTCQLFPK